MYVNIFIFYVLKDITAFKSYNLTINFLWMRNMDRKCFYIISYTSNDFQKAWNEIDVIADALYIYYKHVHAYTYTHMKCISCMEY